MNRFLKDGNAWVVFGAVVVFAAWAMLVWALVNDALTAENMRLVLGSVVAFLVVLFAFDTIIRPLIIEPIAAIMQLRPRTSHPGK
jgi:multisubunit Na+/H+ antiporter MnhE subunit